MTQKHRTKKTTTCTVPYLTQLSKLHRHIKHKGLQPPTLLKLIEFGKHKFVAKSNLNHSTNSNDDIN